MASAPAREGALRSFQVVVAATRALGIGKDGKLPWHLPGEMAFFKELTSKTSDAGKHNAVVMGRRTWESLPPKFRPLPGRLNVVLSARGGVVASDAPAVEGATALPPGVLHARSLEAALEALSSPPHAAAVEHVFVIGGGALYADALASPLCAAVHLTEVDLPSAAGGAAGGDPLGCDTFMPPLDAARFALYAASAPQRTPNGAGRYTFLTYVARAPAAAANGNGSNGAAAALLPPLPPLPAGVRGVHEERQYLDLISRIITTGESRTDRTGTGTLSLFGAQMRFDLRRSFPLLTTKRVFWRGVAEELLWFISGSTDASALRAKDIHIWDGNGSRAFLDASGLGHREEWDLGPVYGFQWRHFGAEYTDMHADYTGKGVDQLADVIAKIKTNPTDRRIIMSAWNPAALRDMALPPCHMFAQFYVARGELSCLMYQRSCDMGLGVPFNIASYALLTRLLAHVCGLRAGELVHTLGDAHVYSNHVEALQTQLLREPRPFPTLRINAEKTDIDAFTFDDFELLGYEPHPKIEMKMAV